jgi:hypothetical protein
MFDEMAQHVRRILWRFSDNQKEPEMFVTTRVNYGDSPAGYMAIAAICETVEMFNKGKEEAAWFLKNRKYVDDAPGGAYDNENVQRILQEMESIIEHGGFCFRETIMTVILWRKQGSCKKS